MDVSEDGYVTGSIDFSKLDEIKPKTPEAKAQLEALKAQRDAGLEQVAADEERLAEAGQEPPKDEKKPEPAKTASSSDKSGEKKG